MLQKVPLFLILLTIAICFPKSQAALGGGTCTIPAVGSGPGASTQCTSSANGYCLIDHLTVTGSPVIAVLYDGVCVCYYGYSGSNCATKSSTASSSSKATVLSAAALSAIAAYYLSQNHLPQNFNNEGYYYRH